MSDIKQNKNRMSTREIAKIALFISIWNAVWVFIIVNFLP